MYVCLKDTLLTLIFAFVLLHLIILSSQIFILSHLFLSLKERGCLLVKFCTIKGAVFEIWKNTIQNIVCVSLLEMHKRNVCNRAQNSKC